jgi:hypothetical protein
VAHWLQTPDWDEGHGMYFQQEEDTDRAMGAGSYDAGGRSVLWQLPIVTDAFFHVWLATQNTQIRDRLVKMAYFADRYAMHAVDQYSSRAWGVSPNGQPWHEPRTPVYTNQINTLVIGYKFTGDRRLLDRAKHFFDRWTKGDTGPGGLERRGEDDEVHHFVDTKLASGTGFYYFDYNKGELQYSYLIFENGGNPTLEVGEPDTMPPAAPNGLRLR